MKPYKRSRLRDWAFAITRPGYWLSNHRASKTIDDLVNAIIDNDLIEEVDQYKARTPSGMSLWIANYPYSYGSIYGEFGALPYRRTRKRLRDYIESKRYEILMNKPTGNSNDPS